MCRWHGRETVPRARRYHNNAQKKRRPTPSAGSAALLASNVRSPARYYHITRFLRRR
jgi:hypothetical protein